MMWPFPFAILLSLALRLGFLTVRKWSPHAIRKCANCEPRVAGDHSERCTRSIRCGLPFFLSVEIRPVTTAGKRTLFWSRTGCLAII